MRALSEVNISIQIQVELGNNAGGDIVAQHEPSDIEAQDYKLLCTGSVYNAIYFDFVRAYVWFPLFVVPEGLKEFPVYRAFMVATAVISLVLTGYYGARSSK